MAHIFATRDRDGKLCLWKNKNVIKNHKAGYWLENYNEPVERIVIDSDELQGVKWDDMNPTEVELVTNSTKDDNVVENILLPNTIELDVLGRNNTSNVRTDNRVTIFIEDISFIEECIGNNEVKSIINMKNGRTINSKICANEVKQLINNAKR